MNKSITEKEIDSVINEEFEKLYNVKFMVENASWYYEQCEDVHKKYPELRGGEHYVVALANSHLIGKYIVKEIVKKLLCEI